VSTWKEAAQRAGHREGDLALLRRLIDDSDVTETERDAFAGMLRELEAPDGFFDLTEARRNFALDVERRVGVGEYENLVSSGRAPRGREVPTPSVLLNLPKKPPGRR
jgi:hypothetical protein